MEKVHIEDFSGQNSDFNLVDATGISIHKLSRQASPGTSLYTFDLDKVEAGDYMAIIKQGDKTEIRKIVVVE